MRIFISQPMKGKTDSEIKQERERIVEKVREEYSEAVTVIESFFEGAPADAKPLWFLGKSLEMLAGADLAVFASGWQDARGCRIEHDCAVAYGIGTMEM